MKKYLSTFKATVEKIYEPKNEKGFTTYLVSFRDCMNKTYVQKTIVGAWKDIKPSIGDTVAIVIYENNVKQDNGEYKNYRGQMAIYEIM